MKTAILYHNLAWRAIAIAKRGRPCLGRERKCSGVPRKQRQRSALERRPRGLKPTLCSALTLLSVVYYTDAPCLRCCLNHSTAGVADCSRPAPAYASNSLPLMLPIFLGST